MKITSPPFVRRFIDNLATSLIRLQADSNNVIKFFEPQDFLTVISYRSIKFRLAGNNI